MGLRFWRRKSFGKFLSVNFSKSGPSVSFGPRGARISIGKRGIRRTLGIPGTGLSYISYESRKKSNKLSSGKQGFIPAPSASPPIRLGFFQKLRLPEEEVKFIEGINDLKIGKYDTALEKFIQSSSLPDSSFWAGSIYLQRNIFDRSFQFFSQALVNSHCLGSMMQKYGIQSTSTFMFSYNLEFSLKPEPQYVETALGYISLHSKETDKAIRSFKETLHKYKDNPVVLLACIDGIFRVKRDDEKLYRDIVQFTGDIEPNTPHNMALLLYKAKSLRLLGLYTAARDELSSGLRKKSILTDELELAIRYERGLVYEEMGQKSHARKEWERIYSQSPDYEDVGQKLGL